MARNQRWQAIPTQLELAETASPRPQRPGGVGRGVRAGARCGWRARGHTGDTVLCDGDAGLWRLQRETLPAATLVLDCSIQMSLIFAGRGPSVASTGTIPIPRRQIGCSDHGLRNSPLAIGYQAAAYSGRRATALPQHRVSSGTSGQRHEIRPRRFHHARDALLVLATGTRRPFPLLVQIDADSV
ncbi:MAG: hypothetical protein QOF70_3352 [Acetobacteraceae bacterium]|nr:hypothetical protein [Acetobacteraceae bacterium]